MGLLGKYAAYRWITAGRGGGSDGSTGLVIILAILAAIFITVWVFATVLSFTWNLIYQTVRPVLALYPPVTLPLAVILVGWLFTLIGPYSTEKAKNALDGKDDSSLSFLGNALWGIAGVNAFMLISATESFPEPSGLIGILLTLIVIAIMIYGLIEIFHLPYRCIRLLLHAPRGTVYVIALLAPILLGIVSAAFDVSFSTPITLPTFESEWVEIGIALGIFNILYVGGPLAVLLNQDTIREHAFEGDHSTPIAESEQTPVSG